jgi:hypothetical protein
MCVKGIRGLNLRESRRIEEMFGQIKDGMVQHIKEFEEKLELLRFAMNRKEFDQRQIYVGYSGSDHVIAS